MYTSMSIYAYLINDPIEAPKHEIRKYMTSESLGGFHVYVRYYSSVDLISTGNHNVQCLKMNQIWCVGKNLAVIEFF